MFPWAKGGRRPPPLGYGSHALPRASFAVCPAALRGRAWPPAATARAATMMTVSLVGRGGVRTSWDHRLRGQRRRPCYPACSMPIIQPPPLPDRRNKAPRLSGDSMPLIYKDIHIIALPTPDRLKRPMAPTGRAVQHAGALRAQAWLTLILARACLPPPASPLVRMPASCQVFWRCGMSCRLPRRRPAGGTPAGHTAPDMGLVAGERHPHLDRSAALVQGQLGVLGFLVHPAAGLLGDLRPALRRWPWRRRGVSRCGLRLKPWCSPRPRTQRLRQNARRTGAAPGWRSLATIKLAADLRAGAAASALPTRLRQGQPGPLGTTTLALMAKNCGLWAAGIARFSSCLRNGPNTCGVISS